MATVDTVEEWAGQIRAGSVRAISRAISAIENRAPEAEHLLRELFPASGHAFLVGVTGAPGTGKSTLVDRLAAYYRRNQQNVGIIAVDPTSPFTGGAILGDRIRMQRHAADAGIYIRSMATRGFLGGLARATGDVALLLDAAGKQVILIETVGVGQAEIDIVQLVDCTVVVLVPGLGDDIQNLKAGLMEIADVFVLNKCDREGAERLAQQLRAMLQISAPREDWRPPIVRTIATEDKGIAELAETIAAFRRRLDSAAGATAAPLAGDRRRERKIDYWKQRLLDLLESRLMERVVGEQLGERGLKALAADVAERRKDPYSAVDEVLARAGLR